MPILTCPCGKDFEVKQRNIQRAKYCSKACFYKHRVRPSGLTYKIVAENRGWYKKGEHHSPNTEFKRGRSPINPIKKGERISTATEFKRGHQTWNKGKPHLTESLHPRWKGDAVGYNALHRWVDRKLGTPRKCEGCGCTDAKIFHWHNISHEYKRELGDWQRLCAKCHANKHKNWEKRKWRKVKLAS